MAQFYKRFSPMIQKLKGSNNKYMIDISTSYNNVQTRRALPVGQQKSEEKEGEQQPYFQKNSFLDHCFERSIINRVFDWSYDFDI